jgi:hypothetical protein
MARVLHLLKSRDAALALDVIARGQAAGDTITLALLPGAEGVAPPAGVAVRRVPGDLSYEALLEAIFDADQVITW